MNRREALKSIGILTVGAFLGGVANDKLASRGSSNNSSSLIVNDSIPKGGLEKFREFRELSPLEFGDIKTELDFIRLFDLLFSEFQASNLVENIPEKPLSYLRNPKRFGFSWKGSEDDTILYSVSLTRGTLGEDNVVRLFSLESRHGGSMGRYLGNEELRLDLKEDRMQVEDTVGTLDVNGNYASTINKDQMDWEGFASYIISGYETYRKSYNESARRDNEQGDPNIQE